MSVYVERKYLGLIQYRLDHFKQKKVDLYNFRCPYCLDSKRNKNKARGYIYARENHYFFRCHNCGKSTTFAHFLKDLDSTAYKEYVLELYREGAIVRATPDKHLASEKLDLSVAEKLKERAKYSGATSIYNLPENHHARNYILNRRIPDTFWKEIWYTENFREFMNVNFPDHGKEDEEIPADERIVLFYTARDGSVTHVAGRALGETKLRYITIKVGNVDHKVFGIHRLDLESPAVVVEGQFDSFLVDNCVASGDASLTRVVDDFPNVKWTVCFDNEPRNREIVSHMEKAIDKGYAVVVYPQGLEQKDINDMVLAGMDVNKLIREHTYRGAQAMLKFIRWKRV